MSEFQCQAVLFDMDGTILDSWASADRAWSRWAREIGLHENFSLAGSAHGRQRPDLIRELVPHYSDEQVLEAAEYIRILERDDTEGVIPLDGSAELLNALPEDRWAIVTSADMEVCVARVKSAGLPLPRVIISADEAHRGKPDPLGYLMAAEALGIAATDCVVMEDSPAGLAAAKAAGMRAIATRHTQDDDALFDADAIVDEPSGVRAVVTDDSITLQLR